MSIWSHMSEIISMLAASGRDWVEKVAENLNEMRANRRSVAFTVALIALSAKMAKADGVVTQDEVTAFEKLCQIPDDERANVARLYDLAKKDVAGFDVYAAKLADLLDQDKAILEDVLDGLFSIAKADGILHENELNFLAIVARQFGFDEACYERIVSRHVQLRGADPYKVLGLARNAPLREVKAKRKALLQEHHPDRMIARGVPEEFLAIANARMAAINAAYDEIIRSQAS